MRWTDRTALTSTFPFILPLKVSAVDPPPPAPPWRGARLEPLQHFSLGLSVSRGCVIGQVQASPTGRQQSLLRNCTHSNEDSPHTPELTPYILVRDQEPVTAHGLCKFGVSLHSVLPTCDLGSTVS